MYLLDDVDQRGFSVLFTTSSQEPKFSFDIILLPLNQRLRDPRTITAAHAKPSECQCSHDLILRLTLHQEKQLYYE